MHGGLNRRQCLSVLPEHSWSELVCGSPEDGGPAGRTGEMGRVGSPARRSPQTRQCRSRLEKVFAVSFKWGAYAVWPCHDTESSPTPDHGVPPTAAVAPSYGGSPSAEHAPPRDGRPFAGTKPGAGHTSPRVVELGEATTVRLPPPEARRLSTLQAVRPVTLPFRSHRHNCSRARRRAVRRASSNPESRRLGAVPVGGRVPASRMWRCPRGLVRSPTMRGRARERRWVPTYPAAMTVDQPSSAASTVATSLWSSP
jgi:hypothetical protein